MALMCTCFDYLSHARLRIGLLATRMVGTTTTATMMTMVKMMVTTLMTGVGVGANVDGGDVGHDDDAVDDDLALISSIY